MSENQPTSTAVADADSPVSGNSYDAVPYPSHPFPQTHPERLATVARLFGLAPVDPDAANVLEIGCASGGNLIPMASMAPDAHFVGVDLSGRQIEEGNAKIERLGLGNVELRHANIADAADSLGTFDYVICHGVYSWVPTEVQDAILRTCRDRLSEHGIAFVSYNTYPGWHFRGMIRDMMCYHDNESRTPGERVGQARALLAFLAESVSNEKSAYGMLLKSELDLLKRHNDGYLFHEHLETNNHPCYFHEFMSRAAGFDLQYLGDSAVSTMWIGNFSKNVQETLQRVAPDIIQREQYTDFIRNRLFRQTLLCHSGLPIDRTLGIDRIDDAWMAGRFSGTGESKQIDLSPQASITFEAVGSGLKVTTSDPVFKASLVHLANSWPASIQFGELFQTARKSIQSNQIEDSAKVAAAQKELATQLIRLHVSGLLEAKFKQDRFVTATSDRPETSTYIRDQASSGEHVTNLRHELVQLDDFSRRLCTKLDGTNSRESLIQDAVGLVQSGDLVIHDVDPQQADVLLERMTQAVDQSLNKMARQALLRK